MNCIDLPIGRVIVRYGVHHWGRNASSGFNKCGSLAAFPDAGPPQTGSFCTGCSGGHHRGQFRAWKRSANRSCFP